MWVGNTLFFWFEHRRSDSVSLTDLQDPFGSGGAPCCYCRPCLPCWWCCRPSNRFFCVGRCEVRTYYPVRRFKTESMHVFLPFFKLTILKKTCANISSSCKVSSSQQRGVDCSCRGRLWARLPAPMRWRWSTGEEHTLALIYLPLGGVHYKAPWFINAVDDGGLQGAIKASRIDLRLVIFGAEPV